MRTFTARYPGTCHLSGQPIKVGDLVARAGGKFALVAHFPKTPFEGERIRQTVALTDEEAAIDRDVRECIRIHQDETRLTGSPSTRSAKSWETLSTLAQKRFTALSEIENPYDR